MGYYAPRIPCTANTTGVASAVAANYATTRNATPATTTPGGATTGSIGQTNSSGNSICTELFLTFDTSAVPTGLAGFTTGFLTLNCTTVANASASTDYLEVYQVSSSANSIGGDTLATMTPLGSMPQPTAVGQFSIPFDTTNMTRSSTCILCIASRRQRLATAPVTSETGAIFTSMLGVAASRPFIDIAGPWVLRNIGTVVESVTGTATLTLTEPGGCGAGDLIIAVIGMRSTATAAGSISLPAGWTRLAESYTNNTLTTSGAQPSGTVAYIIRGSSAPSYAFPYAVGNSVIQGQCVAYWAPSGNTVTPDVVGAVTFAAGSVVVNATGITTLTDDALLLHALIGGQEAVMTVFNATSPNVDSGAATNTTQSPTAAWRRRFNSVTSSGADMGVSLADAVKPTAGATGNWTATASIAANHLSFPIAFKMLGAGAVSVSVTGAGLTATAGTAGGAGPTTFNPLDKKDSNVALSNGNLTVTGNGGANNWARSVRPRSGKRYVEFTITTVANTLVGISGGGAITYPGDTADSFGMFSNGSGSIAGAFPFWGPAYTTGDVVGMAVDFTAKLVWYRKNGGAWNGTSGDPTAGTGGNDISAYTGTTHYVVASEDVGGVLIGNFGATAFQTAAPTGYLAWDGTPFVSPGVTSTALAISPGTVTVTAAKAVSPGVTSTQLGITAGTVTVNVGTAVSTTVTSTALATTAGSVTVNIVAGAVPWTPANIGTDLIAWYDYADASTVSITNGWLTQWRDKSGNARHATPDFQTIQANWDGPFIANANSGYIAMPTLPSAYFDFAFAGKPNAAGSYRTLMAQAAGNYHHVILETGTSNLGTYAAAYFQAGTLTWPSVDGQIYFSASSASTVKIGRDGDTLIDETGENFIPDATPYLMNFSVSGGQGFGTAREFVFMTAGMSQDIRDRVSGYLAWKWDAFLGVSTHVAALPSGHPYKSAPPTTAAPATTVNVTGAGLTTTAGSVTVTAKGSTGVTSTALATTPGSVTVSTPAGGTVTGQHIHPDGPYTGAENNDGGVDLNLGFAFCAFAPITITAIRFWKTSIDANTSRNVAIFNASGTSVASGTSSGEPVGVAQWVTVPISPPLVMTGAGLSSSYTAAAQFPGQHYSATANYYDVGKYSTDGKAYALADSESLANTGTGNGCFEYGNSVLTKPGGTFNKGDYWIDVEYSYSSGGGTNVSANVTGASLTTTAGTVTVVAKASTNVTGSVATTTAGTVTVVGKASVNVTGDIVTTTAGTVTVSAKQFTSTTVTGQALATTAGTVTVTAKQAPSVSVIGDVVTASAGSVSIAAGGSISAVAPGGVATTSAGTVTVNAAIAVANVSVPVTGSIATTSAGTVSVTALSPVLVTVTGQSVTASAGSVSVTGKANVTVTGSVATTSAGSVTTLMTTNAPVTGQAISTSAGTVTVFGKANVTLLGEQLTITDGVIDAALGVTVPVTGRSANTSVGSVVVAGDANVEVTDLQIKVRVGVPTFTFDYQLAITGVQATVRVGFAQSPNWGTVPDDKPENWSPLTAGTREEWTPVDHVKNDWTPVPTTTPQDWTEADHPKSDWTRI